MEQVRPARCPFCGNEMIWPVRSDHGGKRPIVACPQCGPDELKEPIGAAKRRPMALRQRRRTNLLILGFFVGGVALILLWTVPNKRELLGDLGIIIIDAPLMFLLIFLPIGALIPFGVIWLISVALREREPRLERGEFCLYLRPFMRDGERGSIVGGETAQMVLDGIVLGMGQLLEEENLEKGIASGLEDAGMQLIALHNPYHQFALAGAKKVYPDDDDWRRTVRQLALWARCILLRVDATEGLRWELALLHDEVEPHRIFVLIGLDMEREIENWPRSHDALVAAGFKVPSSFPGAGSILSFDTQHCGVLIAEKCVDVRQMASAMLQALARIARSHG